MARKTPLNTENEKINHAPNGSTIPVPKEILEPSLNIVLLDNNCMPYKKYKSDAGFDIRARINKLTSIGQFDTVKIPTGICVDIPEGCMGILMPRSGLSSNDKIVVEMPPIDSGYTDEIQAIVTNNSSVPYHMKPYERIAQLVIVPIAKYNNINVVEKLPEKDRNKNGFGSTGKD